MKISWGSNVSIDRIATTNGYGYATEQSIKSLRRLGHDVQYNDPTADFHIHFDQPQHFSPPRKDMYKIIFHPWESTRLQRGWVKTMNECDEVWTPSPVIAKWYKRSKVNVPIYVYEHGVDSYIWTPKDRPVEDKFRILHVGFEALRKGGKTTLDAFRAAFPNNSDVELTLKLNHEGWNIKSYGRVNFKNSFISVGELVDLHHSHHLFVYPSWGEGFGLNPLQAMATGMPTICTAAWAPYKDFVPESQQLNSTLTKSPWQKEHPGQMFKPDFDDLVDKMRYCYENYSSESEKSMSQVPQLTQHYNWDRLTDETFISLENRLKNLE